MKNIEKKYKIYAIVAIIIVVCVVIFLSNIISYNSPITTTASTVDTETDLVKVVSSATISMVSSEVDSSIDSSVDSDGFLKPADCNEDFWAIKLGVAECYDHILKKGHMNNGTTYYQGDCEEHDFAEIQEIARHVKLLCNEDEDGNIFYAVILPNGWDISVYDSRICAIIDAQIDGSGAVYPKEEISIVMYYYNNSIQIEIAEE